MALQQRNRDFLHERYATPKPATIRQYLSTIALAHRVANLPNPCADEFVQLEVKGLYIVISVRWEHIKKFIEAAGEGIRADRELALLSVAYDTMARRAELVALDLEDFAFLSDGSGRVLIRRSKTDQVGEGNTAYLQKHKDVTHRPKLLSACVECDIVARPI